MCGKGEKYCNATAVQSTVTLSGTNSDYVHGNALCNATLKKVADAMGIKVADLELTPGSTCAPARRRRRRQLRRRADVVFAFSARVSSSSTTTVSAMKSAVASATGGSVSAAARPAPDPVASPSATCSSRAAVAPSRHALYQSVQVALVQRDPFASRSAIVFRSFTRRIAQATSHNR